MFILDLYVAAAAKSLQLCLTLRDPTVGSPAGSSVPGILQARILEWVAISFSTWSVYSWIIRLLHALLGQSQSMTVLFSGFHSPKAHFRFVESPVLPLTSGLWYSLCFFLSLKHTTTLHLAILRAQLQCSFLRNHCGFWTPITHTPRGSSSPNTYYSCS